MDIRSLVQVITVHDVNHLIIKRITAFFPLRMASAIREVLIRPLLRMPTLFWLGSSYFLRGYLLDRIGGLHTPLICRGKSCITVNIFPGSPPHPMFPVMAARVMRSMYCSHKRSAWTIPVMRAAGFRAAYSAAKVSIADAGAPLSSRPGRRFRHPIFFSQHIVFELFEPEGIVWRNF